MKNEFKTIYAEGEKQFDELLKESTEKGWIPNNSTTYYGDAVNKQDGQMRPRFMLILKKDKIVNDGWAYKKKSATRYNTGDPFDVVLEIYERPHGDGTIRLQRLWQWQCKNAKEAEGEEIECILPGCMSYDEYGKQYPKYISKEQFDEAKKTYEANKPDNKIFYTFEEAKEYAETWCAKNTTP